MNCHEQPVPGRVQAELDALSVDEVERASLLVWRSDQIKVLLALCYPHVCFARRAGTLQFGFPLSPQYLLQGTHTTGPE